MLRAGIITQARMTSTRLPGKILLSANGKTILEHHLSRLTWSEIPIYVATTINATDDPVISLANSLNVPWYRGSESNVLERYYRCAEKYSLDIVIRVTSDCPLIDGEIIKKGLEKYKSLNNPSVYYSNCLLRTYPRGLDFEIFSFDLLKEAFREAVLESEREHVSTYINQNRSGKVIVVNHTDEKDFSNLRWTLDTPEDWLLIKTLIEDFKVDALAYEGILKVVQMNPSLVTLNTHIKQKEIKS